MRKITTTFRTLAEIGEKSPGYLVLAVDGDQIFELGGIRFERRDSGRRNRAVVVFEMWGQTRRADAGSVVSILD